MLTVYATLTGTNRDQLSTRLSWLARQYLRYTATKPGQPARLDAFSDEARSMAGALGDAVRILVDRDQATSRTALVVAVRRAEDSWQKVQVDLHRSGTTWADLRVRPGYRRDLPVQRVTGGETPQRLTLVHDSRTVEADRLAAARLAQARAAAGRATDAPTPGRGGSDSRIAEKVTAGPASRRRELTPQR
ncbi:hypothetical protein I6A60_31730 [Frankia sp. AgB1.9]|uniref:hypothetical protein n=1 Tax=unclassified Frankia TaxID=2632575 RepID=UPI001931513F|nr:MULTISPECIES: hypothetical protein [unclassified Frankia]MBL7552399.1 hypothetical protein [Frankia sp. AgB1.9]